MAAAQAMAIGTRFRPPGVRCTVLATCRNFSTALDGPEAFRKMTLASLDCVLLKSPYAITVQSDPPLNCTRIAINAMIYADFPFVTVSCAPAIGPLDQLIQNPSYTSSCVAMLDLGKVAILCTLSEHLGRRHELHIDRISWKTLLHICTQATVRVLRGPSQIISFECYPHANREAVHRNEEATEPLG